MPRTTISARPRVTLIVPVRNEERFIEQFLDGLCKQDYPLDLMEILVADGQSNDRTVAIAERFRDRLPHLELYENPVREKAPALNLCIPLAAGEVILIMDCHTRYPSNYVSALVSHLREKHADYVGGRVDTEPGGDTQVARAIAAALSHSFGVGGGTYRTSSGSGEGLAPFGCYRRELPLTIGGYNERLPRTHDDEFIARIMRHDGLCLVCGDVCSTYFTRPTVNGLCEQMFGNGSNHVATFMELPGHFFVRHYVPFAFVASLMFGLICTMAHPMGWAMLALILVPYLAIDLLCSFSVARRIGWRFLPFMFGLFPLIHIVYGLGTWWGVLMYGILKRHRAAGKKTGQELIGLDPQVSQCPSSLHSAAGH